MLKFLNTTTQKIFATIIAGGIASQSSTAMATSNDFESLTANVTNQASNLPTALSFTGYTIGSALVGMGLFGVKKHVEDPAQNKLAGQVAKVFIGGTLVALPSMVDLANNSSEVGNTVQVFKKNTVNPF